MVVGKGLPDDAVLGIVFPHCAPLAFGKIRPPAFPIPRPILRFLEPIVFRRLAVIRGMSGHREVSGWRRKKRLAGNVIDYTARGRFAIPSIGIAL
jgi:hypothetical protein